MSSETSLETAGKQIEELYGNIRNQTYCTKDDSLKITYVMAFATFFIGDLVTTYLVLKGGGYHEGNILLNALGFNGTILLKILFFIGLFKMIKWLKNKQLHEYAIFTNGAIFAIGLLTVLFNMRFYQ